MNNNIEIRLKGIEAKISHYQSVLQSESTKYLEILNGGEIDPSRLDATKRRIDKAHNNISAFLILKEELVDILEDFKVSN